MNPAPCTTIHKVLIRTTEGWDTVIEVPDFDAARTVARPARCASNIMVRLEVAGRSVLRWDRSPNGRQNRWHCMELDATQPTGQVPETLNEFPIEHRLECPQPQAVGATNACEPDLRRASDLSCGSALGYSLSASAPAWRGQPIGSADPSTFELLGGILARDAQRVFVLGKPYPAIHRPSFEILSPAYARDRASVYVISKTKLKLIPGVDAASFAAVGERYGRDGVRAYCGDRQLRLT